MVADTSSEEKATEDSRDMYISLSCWKKEQQKSLVYLNFYIQQENPLEIKVKYFQIHKSENFISSVTNYDKCQKKFFRLKKKMLIDNKFGSTEKSKDLAKWEIFGAI